MPLSENNEEPLEACNSATRRYFSPLSSLLNLEDVDPNSQDYVHCKRHPEGNGNQP